MAPLPARLREDDGFILRGGWAVAFLVLMFVLAVAGQVPWEFFGGLLLVAGALTGISYALSLRESRQTVNAPLYRGVPLGDEVRCPKCSTVWILDADEKRFGYTCEQCGYPIRPSSVPTDAPLPATVAGEPPEPIPSSMFCGCGAAVIEGDVFCRSCGDRVEPSEPAACACGADIMEGDTFCHACGERIEPE